MNIGAVVRSAPYLIRAMYGIRRGKPIAMSFDVADFCTLACPYCYWLQSTQHRQIQCEETFRLHAKLWPMVSFMLRG